MKVDKGLGADALVFAEVWKEKKPVLFGDPDPGYVGIWRGRTAPPPRIGLAAPKRWAAEADIERPYGPRPYEVQRARAVASWFITDQLRLSNDRCSDQRLRDQKAHILERRRESGALFQGAQWPRAAEPKLAHHARGIRWAELEGIELHRRHDQLRWFIDGRFDENVRGIDTAIADAAGFKFREMRIKIVSSARRRRKPGRKPLGAIAMTGPERKRKYDRNKRLQALVTPERRPTGARQPLPLGRSAPVNLLRKDMKT